MTQIHDSEIVSYEVDLKNSKLRLNLQQHELENLKHIDVVFNVVLVHFFETALQGSIIFDVEERGIDKFIKENSNLLNKQKEYSWPIDYNDVKELNDLLVNNQYRYYIITSSYGLNGWVIAKNYEIIAN